MSVISVLSCLSLLLAAAVAQTPEPCVVPPLLSGHLTVMASNGLVSSTGTISYDSFGQKMHIRSTGTAGNETYVVDQLFLFNKNVYYEMDWKTVSCKKMPLNSDFIPMQVPSDAKLMGQAVMGSSSSWGMGVLTNTWYGAMSSNGFYMSVFTEVGCIPLTFTSYTPEAGWTTVSTFNWVIGITNPMGFIPPVFCDEASLEDKETPDTFFTALESLAMKTKRGK
ncbi:ependymin-like [Mugil cephalus]|uniref:ependymin-like n=1 Tax=Mugil cephalus TaxID=48193 RepID=UPI001FB82BF3|nr:ependymin-like [Mugil cephalus]